jgi:hypothetical protein
VTATRTPGRPALCVCAVRGPERCGRHRDHYDPLAHWTDGGDLVPGYSGSPDELADAADQARWEEIP